MYCLYIIVIVCLLLVVVRVFRGFVGVLLVAVIVVLLASVVFFVMLRTDFGYMFIRVEVVKCLGGIHEIEYFIIYYDYSFGILVRIERFVMDHEFCYY